MRPAPPRSVYRPTNRYFLHHGLTRFCALQTTENSCAEPSLAMASRTKTSLPSDAENTGYDDEKSFSTTPRSCQKLTSVDAGDSFFFFFVCSKLVKYESGILNQPFSLIARRCQYQPPFQVQASSLFYPDGCCWWGILACGGMGYWPPTLCCCCCCCCMYCW